MAQDTQVADQTSGVKAVTPSAEELIHNLTQAWHEHADAASVNGASVRTSTMNLVIFSADQAAANDAETSIPQLVERHPCRIVHIIRDANVNAPLSASSQAHSKVEGGVRVISCESVTLQGGMNALATLQGVIAPLLSPDLPVCLWWRGNPPFEGHVFDQLVQAADRVIYDSAWFLEAEEDLPWAVNLIEHNVKFEVAFTDVNFARLTSWRNLIAQFFDGAQQMQALNTIDRLIIYVADEQVTPDRVPVQAWLMLGWFGTRLGWTARGPVSAPLNDESRFSVKSNGNPIEVRIHRVTDNTGYRGIKAVELHCTKPTPGSYRVEMMVGDKLARTITSLDGVPPLERVVEMDVDDSAGLISNELELPGRDRVYEEALKFSAPLPAPVDDANPS